MKHAFATLTTVALLLSSCSSSTSVSLLCNEPSVEIYVNEDYVGRGLVSYTSPKGQDEIRVSCRENGIEIYSRSFYIKGKNNQLFELTIPKDYRYNSNPTIIKSK